MSLKKLQEKLGEPVIAVFHHHPTAKVGIVYSEDSEVAERLVSTINEWSEEMMIKAAPWAERPKWVDGERKESDLVDHCYIGGKLGCVSNEEFAFGTDVPIFAVRDFEFPLE